MPAQISDAKSTWRTAVQPGDKIQVGEDIVLTCLVISGRVQVIVAAPQSVPITKVSDRKPHG